MAHMKDILRLSAAPASDDIRLVSNFFKETCNCYAYAVQDYLAGYLSEDNKADRNYLPRPGQIRGHTYMDLKDLNAEGMRRAIHEDGLNFAGMTYPKKIPAGHYVICCFLEPGEYHFIRQNRDGSWSSKDGRNLPTSCDCDNKPLTNPENYYRGKKGFQFIGYFYVPEGGIKIGVRACERKRLEALKKKAQTPDERREKKFLTELVALSEEGDRIVQNMQELSLLEGSEPNPDIGQMWADYRHRFKRISRLMAGYTRRDILKQTYTHPKNAKNNDVSR